MRHVIKLILITTIAVTAWAQSPPPVAAGPLTNAANKPAILDKVGIEQRLNQQLPLDLVFRDETGKTVRLGDYFGHKPVILSLVYYQCPMLCTEVLNGLTSTLSVLKFDVGKEFNVVTVSFDPRETPALAAAKRRVYLNRYGRPGADQGWHFLTGDQASIDALTKAVGFNYQWDPQAQQFAHATAIMLATPQGKLAQYYYGVEYSPKDLRLGLIQASQNKIGNVVDQLLLYCYHYDPATGKYGAVIQNVMRIAGVITLLILGAALTLMSRKGPRQEKGATGAGAGRN